MKASSDLERNPSMRVHAFEPFGETFPDYHYCKHCGLDEKYHGAEDNPPPHEHLFKRVTLRSGDGVGEYESWLCSCGEVGYEVPIPTESDSDLGGVAERREL